VAVPAHRLHPLPDGVDLLSGALAEPAAVGVHAVARSGVKGGERALVVGAGVIGLMVLKAARALGCEVTVVEGNPDRMARSLEFGASRAFVAGAPAEKALIDAGGSEGFAAVFECVGKPETIDLAVKAAPRGGTVVVVGVPPGPTLVPMPLVQDGELDVRGTLMYTGEDFTRALELIRQGSITAAEFVTHAVSLDEISAGYEIMSEASAGTLKVIVRVQEGA
ncbi:MAG: zinc-dependent alcohol dehydrogenase, partial [Candidatus Geothermincolia bacterium]